MNSALNDDPEGYATDDALVSTHALRATLPVYVAPSRDARPNTVRPAVAPIACWRLNEALFDFDSSLILPGVRASAPRFASVLRANLGSLAAIFGHADASGSDEYNKVLSGRRAKALYALLVRDAKIWEQLYREPAGNDRWNVRAIQVMLSALKAPASAPPDVYYAGDPSGMNDAATRAAVRCFQDDEGLTVDGIAGPNTRVRLFSAYMDAVCIDAEGQPFSMTPKQFVGYGADARGKGAYQGCSEFNPVTILSRADAQKYVSGTAPLAERNARNAPNRRAMVFLFSANPTLTSAGWPCPRADESGALCRAMFWPDGDERRAPGPSAREYREDQRTMACSWYDRFARLSPCEGRTFTRITVALRDRSAELIEQAPYRIQAAGRSREGRTASGMVTLTVAGIPERCIVLWGRAGDPLLSDALTKPPFRLELYVTYDTGSDEEQAQKRLHNIGYPSSYPFDVALRAFQGDAELPETGRLDEATRRALVAAHGTLATSVVELGEVDHG
jgi:Putative peptidoglycan binding domain/OmpA family